MAEVSKTKSSSNSIFGNVSLIPNRSPVMEKTGVSPLNPSCPQCGSQKVWRDGVRNTVLGYTVQRWLCRNCGYRFSDPNEIQKSRSKIEIITRNREMTLKTEADIISSRQICVTAKETKNLVSSTELKTVVGDRRRSPKPLKLELLPEATRGYIAKFEAYLARNGYDEFNTYPSILVRLAGAGANLLDPESIKDAIAKGTILEGKGNKKVMGKRWSNSMKAIAVCAYGAFCDMEKIVWDKPVYHQDEIEVIPPKEKDLELLIVSAKLLFATFLLCLKETFADPSEVLACKWSELKDNMLFINHPVKRHNPGHYELSDKLMRMLNALPHKDERIFPFGYRNAANNMRNLRRRVAKRFDNSEVLLISLKSFRHWGGTMLAYATNGNVPKMARALRHKDWKSTQRYCHILESLEDDDFDATSATTLEEILALGKDGWQKYDEIKVNGMIYHCYKKPKRFGCFKKDKPQNYVDKSQNSGDSLICK